MKMREVKVMLTIFTNESLKKMILESIITAP
jgi:hypothetical protein